MADLQLMRVIQEIARKIIVQVRLTSLQPTWTHVLVVFILSLTVFSQAGCR